MNLYDSMAKHPDTGPVMDLLDLVDPVDEFSKALVLARDCFSPNNTLRGLARRKLRGLLAERTGLMAAYEAAVMETARARGYNPKTFMEAATKMYKSPEFALLRTAYQAQVRALMGRPLESGD